MIKVFIQTLYPAPYRVGVFNCLNDYEEIDCFVVFEKEDGDKRNKNWFDKDFKFNCCFAKEKKEYRKQLKKTKKHEYDIVIAYEYSSISSMRLLLKCIMHKIPYCINCDGAIIKHNFIKDKIKRFFIKRARACLANGKAAENYFFTYGAKKERIYMHKFTSLYEKDLINNIIPKSKKEKLRKELGINEKKVFLSIGSFIERKGFDILLEAIKRLNNKSIAFVIIGGGEKSEEYKKIVSENKLDNVYIIDFLSKNEILKYYDAADAFVFPTREDIWGLVINEAMSRGLPIISTNMCVAATELVDEKNGKIIEVDSVEELANAIREFNSLSDNELENMGRISMERNKNYTIENIAESHFKVVNEIYGEN